MPLHHIEKTTAEAYTFAIDYAGRLPSGASVSSGTVAAVDQDGNDESGGGTPVIASTTATISGTEARVKVQNGTNGERYKLTFTTTLSTSDVLVDTVWMRVVDK